MTLIHHSTKDYNVAASAAAANARNILEDMFKGGRSSAASALDRLQREQPEDYVAHAKSLSFFPEELRGRRQILTAVTNGGDVPTSYANHPHALGQLGDVAGVPRRFVQKRLETDWGTDQMAYILNDTYKHLDSRHLIRVVDNQVRGFLSDKYRRMDSAPILESFIKTASALGAVPVDSHTLPTKFYLKMMLPMVFEPVPNEVLAFGIKIQSSDYGDGALTIAGFIFRLWCTNYAMCENALRKIHLGSRLDANLQLSQKTYDMDTKALASAAEDVVSLTLGPQKVDEKLEIIRVASEQKLGPKKMESMLKQGSRFLKEEREGITELFNTPDVEKLPPGNTAWRLSNAISLFAKQTEPDRALELEQLAGDVAGLVVEK
jgi:hypothetical protein